MSAPRSHRPETTPLCGTALFVHGLWLSGGESFLMRRWLAHHGIALRVLPYSSLGESLDTVARRCARQAQAVAARTNMPVHLVGHSLGGIVIHRALQLGLLQPDRFSGDYCRVVFLGTPIRGSQSARALNRWRLARGLLGRSGTELLREEAPARWEFAAQLGLIAGTSPYGLGRLLGRFTGPHDGTVAVAETQLEGATDTRLLPVTHTGMWLSREVADCVARFLNSGHF